MKRISIVGVLLAIAFLLTMATGCDKERIVESTEYIQEIEYVELPADTVYRVDTVSVGDSVIVNQTDTVHLYDTIVQVEHVYDTVVTVVNHVDTIHHSIIDTILTVRCDPNEHMAVAALHYHSDPAVMTFINSEFGYTDGWILYLSSFQLDLTQQSLNVYDIYGYIDYWVPDWSGYYPLEFYWRMTFTGSDPANPDHWTMTEPPTASPAMQPGIRISTAASSEMSLR